MNGIVPRQRRGPADIRVRAAARSAVDHEVGHVVTHPATLLLVPPDVLLPLAPGFARRVGRRPVVEDPPVGRPGPAPLRLAPSLAAVRHPVGRVVHAARVHPGVDPAPGRRRSVGAQLGVRGEQVARLRAGQVAAVDLLEHRRWIGLARIGLVVLAGRIIPGQVQQRPIAVIGRVRQLRPDPLAQLVEEVEVALAVAGRVERLVAPLQHPLRLGERPGLLGVARRGQEEHLGRDVLGPHLARGDLRAVLPPGGRLDEVEVPHHQPLQVGQAETLHAAVGRPDGRVLAEQEVALDLVVEHGGHGLVGTVGARQPGQVVVGPVVVGPGGVAPPRLEHADQVVVGIGEEPLLLLRPGHPQVVGERVVQARARHRHVPGKEVEQRRDVGRPLDAGVPAQGHDAAARAPHVAEQQLQDRGGPDELRAQGVLGPAEGVGEAGRALPAGVLRDRSGRGSRSRPR